MDEPANFLDRLADRVRLGEPGRLTPGGAAVLRRTLLPLARILFRPSARGFEHLPADRPYLLVANHSGGGAAEVFAFIDAWLAGVGPERRLAGMAHPLGFCVPGGGALLRHVGAIPSTRQHALRTLAAGIPVLVFPGGDYEAFRPIWQARRVDFGGRKGFLRLARDAWVPVVPLGIHGSHYTVPILWRSHVLAWITVLPRLIGLKRLPLSLLMATGLILIAGCLTAGTLGPASAACLAWAWIVLPISYFAPIVPWPVRLTFGPPLEPSVLFGERGAGGPLDGAYERVVAEVQQLVLAGCVNRRS